MSMTNQVIRGNKKSPLSRYSPYTSGTNFTNEKEKQKEEAVRLGVEFSLLVAEAMFLLSDDIRYMLRFCHWLMSFAGKKDFNGPLVGRVFHVIEYVFETYVKPKNGIYRDSGRSIQWELIGTFRHDFTPGIRRLANIVAIIKNGGIVKSSRGFELQNQVLKRLKEKLRSVNDVSEANGFVRDTIESNILQFWTSLFETTPEVMNPRARVLEVFGPLLDEANRNTCCRILDSLLI